MAIPSIGLSRYPAVEAFGEPFIPEHLCDNARGCIATIRLSMPARVYSALDSFILSAFATAWALHKRAALEIANPDFTVIVKSKRGSPQRLRGCTSRPGRRS